MQLILASSSRYRAELLSRLGLPFSIQTPAVDESRLPGETPEVLVRRLAQTKAEAVGQSLPSGSPGLIIGSDQVAVLGQRVLTKPGSLAIAREQLASLSGRSATFLTSLCLLNTATGRSQLAVEPFRVHFRTLSAASIEQYLAREHPLDCAGAFKAEGLGIRLFRALEGEDPNSLIGLPLIRLVDFLLAEGVDPLSPG